MKIEVKNPIYMILLNWIILLIGNLGIPLIPMVVENRSQQYILSFLVMNFHFLGNSKGLVTLITSWIIPIVLFGIFIKPDWKIPLQLIAVEFSLYLFGIILMKRNAFDAFILIKIDLFVGICITSGIILLLYIPIMIQLLLRKKRKSGTNLSKELKFISKCPHCGKEYQSNPSICYSCSKQITSS